MAIKQRAMNRKKSIQKLIDKEEKLGNVADSYGHDIQEMYKKNLNNMVRK